MKSKITSHILIALGASLLSVTSNLSAQEVKQGMNSLLTPLRDLQPYLVDQDAFSDSANGQKISSLLQDLRKHFHTIERIPTKFHNLPGFTENLRQVSDLLDNSTRRFSEGKTSYAW